MAFVESDSRIELLVCSPHQPVRVISARVTGQISALQSLWPESPKRFIYNGNQLHETMTFNFYGIRDGDSIIALPKYQFNDLKCSQWMCLSRDYDSFNEYMKWMVDPRTSDEAARIRDLHIMKMEKRPRAYIKMRYPMFEENDSKTDTNAIFQKIEKTNLDLSQNKSDAPSEEPLPVLW